MIEEDPLTLAKLLLVIFGSSTIFAVVMAHRGKREE